MTQSKAPTTKSAFAPFKTALKDGDKEALAKAKDADPEGFKAFLATLPEVDPLEAMRQAASGHPEP